MTGLCAERAAATDAKDRPADIEPGRPISTVMSQGGGAARGSIHFVELQGSHLNTLTSLAPGLIGGI